MAETWRRCSACKQPIELGAIHYVCSVSTCNRARTALAFCSVDCWEIHLPTERHREAWAIEERAPTTPDPRPEPGQPTPRRRRTPVGTSGPSGPGSTGRTGGSGRTGSTGGTGRTGSTGRTGGTGVAGAGGARGGEAARTDEILVVASRLKAYIRERAGYNTSDGVLRVLSAAIREICDESIRNARRAERQTVLDRDVPRG